jgi:hypothetical protein
MQQPSSPPVNEALGKPPGTVRAYLALSVVGSFELAHVVGASAFAVTGHLPEAMTLMGSLAVQTAAIVGYYFGTKGGGMSTQQYLMMPPEEPYVEAVGFTSPASQDEGNGSRLRTRR